MTENHVYVHYRSPSTVSFIEKGGCFSFYTCLRDSRFDSQNSTLKYRETRFEFLLRFKNSSSSGLLKRWAHQNQRLYGFNLGPHRSSIKWKIHFLVCPNLFRYKLEFLPIGTNPLVTILNSYLIFQKSKIHKHKGIQQDL